MIQRLLLVGAALSMCAAGCGSSAGDETNSSRPERGDDDTDDDVRDGDGDDSAGDDDANEASDDDAVDGAADPGDTPADSGDSTNRPDEAALASLCDELCGQWAGCEEVGGDECAEECSDATSRFVETGCYPLAAAFFECILASGECPEQAEDMCQTEANALGRCADGAQGSGGGVLPNPAGGSGAPVAGSSSGSGSSGSNGGGVDVVPAPAAGGAPSGEPNGADDGEPNGAAGADPTEHFGGEESTPDAILEAAEIAQCSEFEVDEFECGSSGYSSGGSLCSVECYDPDDRVWSSLCRDGVCRCLYEGITYCQCEHEGPSDFGCNSCCPQLTDEDFGF